MKNKIFVLFSLIFVVAFLSLASAQTFVYRGPVEKDLENNVTNVQLAISSSENVIALEESFSSASNADCRVLYFSVSPQIGFADVNSALGIFLLGDNSSSLRVLLNYSIPYECDVANGTSYNIPSEGESGINVSENQALPSLQTKDISQAKDPTEYNNFVKFSVQRSAFLDILTSLRVSPLVLILIIVALIVLVLAIFLILFLRKPTKTSAVKAK